MASRGSAIAIVASMMAAVFGCASRGGGAPSAAGSAVAATAESSAAASKSGPKVQGAAFNEDADGARLVLSSDQPLLYTAYEPRPDLLVVDLPGSVLSDGFVPPAASGTLVSSLRVDPLVEMGKPLTRLTIGHKEGTHFDVHTVGQGLAVTFDAAPEATAAAGTAAPASSTPAPAPPATLGEKLPSQDSPPRGELAHAAVFDYFARAGKV